MEDGLFCEYAYIINLDTKKLEIIYGFEDRTCKSYDLLNLDYEQIKKDEEDFFKLV